MKSCVSSPKIYSMKKKKNILQYFPAKSSVGYIEFG